MDKARVLCQKDAIMMHEFSRQSLERIRRQHPKIFSLPFFSSYLEANVRKEVDKDSLIILETADAFAKGRPACDLDLEEIFEKTKLVDRAFLKSLHIPSFALSVKYGDIADIRIRRIWRIARTVYRLLENWPEGKLFDAVARDAYTMDQFKAVILDILSLYSEETRMLSESLKVLPPFQGVIGSATQALFQAMEDAKEGIADAYVQKLFEARIVHA